MCFNIEWVGPSVSGLWWGSKSWEKWVADWKLSFHGKEQSGCRKGRMGLWIELGLCSVIPNRLPSTPAPTIFLSLLMQCSLIQRCVKLDVDAFIKVGSPWSVDGYVVFSCNLLWWSPLVLQKIFFYELQEQNLPVIIRIQLRMQSFLLRKIMSTEQEPFAQN